MVGLTITALTGTSGASAAPVPPARDPKPIPLQVEPQAVPAGAKLSPRLTGDPARTQSVFVQLRGQGAADTAATSRRLGASAGTATEASRGRRTEISRTADAVVAAAKAEDNGSTKLFELRNSVPGVAISTTAKAVEALAARQDVVRITPLSTYTTTNSSAAQLTQVLRTWQQTGRTGKGVRIGIIDTGIDYTHADFGGPGTAAAYEKAHATADSGGAWKPTAKVVGGVDFAGDTYDAGSTNPASRIPHRDDNPLDCNGHGSHVAGTAAGTGVNADGTTFTGSYRALTASKLDAMKIGPGMAPSASLYALRVFGCEGSTNLVLPALDWALDPNGDGNTGDHLDVVNLSLGSAFAPADDPENAVVDNLAKHGVLPVISAGNSGDYTDAGGSPGSATRALTVASSVDKRQILDGLRVTAPAELAGVKPGQQSSDYPWSTAPDVSGTATTLTQEGNLDGCDPLSDADRARVAGKVAWLEWDDNDATRRCGSATRSNNAAAAGAIGAVFTSKTTGEFAAGILGSKTIPVFQLTGPDSAALRPAAQAQTLQVTFSNSLAGTVVDDNPELADTLSSFSSRSSHGLQGVVKPDVAAPGQSISSAAVGTGNGRESLSGTSMAAPHTAGIAALVLDKHPTWTVGQIKAAVMNTATHDVYTDPNRRGLRYGPNRVGAGRVDADDAVATSVLAYSLSKPGAVSASFGVVEAPITDRTLTRTQSIRVRNTAGSKTSVSLSYEPVIKQPGVRYSVSPSRVSVKARGTATVKVTMTVTTASLRRTIDPTMSTTTVNPLTGRTAARQFVPDASGHLLVKPSSRRALRVPVYGSAKPVSETRARPAVYGAQRVVELSGRGVNQGSGRTAFQSKASVLALGDTSRRLPTCAALQTSGCTANGSARSADLRYTGAGVYVPPGSRAEDGVLWFGLTTWARGVLENGWEADVSIDTNADAKADFTLVGITLDESDQPLAALVNAAGKVLSYFPVNFSTGETDTNAYDNDVALLPVSVADLGLASANSMPIQYQVSTFSPSGDPTAGGEVDSTGWVKFDVANPPVTTPLPLFPDAGGVAVPYTTATSASAAQKLTTTAKVSTSAERAAASADRVAGLVLHLGGRTGHRAEVLQLPAS